MRSKMRALAALTIVSVWCLDLAWSPRKTWVKHFVWRSRMSTCPYNSPPWSRWFRFTIKKRTCWKIRPYSRAVKCEV